MSKDDQAIKAISDMLSRLRGELASYVKATEDKISALELTYETLTGTKVTKPAQLRLTAGTSAPRSRRRGMKIDRQGGQRAYEFLKERGDKGASVKMVARKFSISEEAASQRLLKLYREGKAARLGKGQYIDAAKLENGSAAQMEMAD